MQGTGRPVVARNPLRCMVLPLTLLLTPAAASANPGFEDRCASLVAEAKVSVVFEDKPAARDDSRSLTELKGLSGSGPNAHHNVLGLTHALPSARLDVIPHMLADETGRTCVVPSLNLKLGLSEFQVYLARELKDPCRRRIVEEHENEHANVWRNHLRAGARLLESALRGGLAKPIYFRSREEVRSDLQHRIDELVNPLLQKLKDGVVVANRQIDSPASYQFEENRMRACPPF
jgi:hypothetical protein